MDLITDLPPTARGFDSIVTFVDRLSKQVHFAPVKKQINAEELVVVFRKTIYRLHGLPKVIITDRDERFVSKFWRSLFSSLGTELRFSTAYHPQTDGQSERTNRLLEECLRHFINPRQDDWDEYLDLAEFANNDSVQLSTGYTAFYLTYGQHPISAVDFANPPVLPSAETFINTITSSVHHAKQKIQEAQTKQCIAANRTRRDVQFKVGDKVRLSTVDLNLPSNMSRKLGPKYNGPYTIAKVINPVVYKLALPPELKRIHPVFHVSLLQPWRADPDHPDTQTRPDAIYGTMDQHGELYQVDTLMDKRIRKKGRRLVTEYLVRWAGYGPDADQWLEASMITQDLKDDYEATHHADLPTTTVSTRRSTCRRTPASR